MYLDLDLIDWLLFVWFCRFYEYKMDIFDNDFVVLFNMFVFKDVFYVVCFKSWGVLLKVFV